MQTIQTSKPIASLWRWVNPRYPISTLLEVLHLLSTGEGKEAPHLTYYEINGVKTWYIASPWNKSSDMGMSSSGTLFFQIKQPLTRDLRRNGFVDTMPEKKSFLNDLGLSALQREQNIRLKKARQIFLSQIGKSLLGAFSFVDFGYEFRYYGRFYAEFQTPQGQRCRIYPDENLLLCPFPTHGA